MLAISGIDDWVELKLGPRGAHAAVGGQDLRFSVTIGVAEGLSAPIEVRGTGFADFVLRTRGADLRLASAGGWLVGSALGSDLRLQIASEAQLNLMAEVQAAGTRWSASLFDSVSRALYACSRGERGAPILRGAQIGNGAAAATDGYRLAVVEIPVAETQGAVVVPWQCLHYLAQVRNPNDEIAVSCDENVATFSCDSWRLTSRLIEGNYPEWKKLIPARSAAAIRVYRDQLLDALTCLRELAAHDDRKCVTLSGTNESELRVWSEVRDFGYRQERIEGTTLLEDVSFNLEYLEQAVAALPSEIVEIEMETVTGKATIRSPGYLAVILPINPRPGPAPPREAAPSRPLQDEAL